jgi:hypothetical protein
MERVLVLLAQLGFLRLDMRQDFQFSVTKRCGPKDRTGSKGGGNSNEKRSWI